MKYVLVSGGVISGIGKGMSFLLVQLNPSMRCGCMGVVVGFHTGVVGVGVLSCLSSSSSSFSHVSCSKANMALR